MFARVSRFQEDPTSLDEGVAIIRDTILPKIETIPGFLGVQMLINRSTGETLSLTYWETEAALQESEDAANRLREEAADLTQSQITSVDRFEVALRVGV